jgi:hypothetical protein
MWQPNKESRMKSLAVVCLAAVLLVPGLQDPKPSAPSSPRVLLAAPANPQIDYPGFLEIARKAENLRAARRLGEAEFAAAMREPGTVLLDARSADKYQLRHIAGAVSLPFTDFTAASLATVIPSKDTRVLIYCNNNFAGDERALATKAAAASLNISTYIALATYGYTNVWELAPKLDVKASKLAWAGTAVGR